MPFAIGAPVINWALTGAMVPTNCSSERSWSEYLRRGWPVVVTGSKFFGGPALSGAVLFPLERRAGSRPAGPGPGAPGLGTVLRWTAALDAIERFSSVAHRAAPFLRQWVAAIRDAIAANPTLLPIGGLEGQGLRWADRPTIVTFAIRDPIVRGRFLSTMELRPTYERLARDGILLDPCRPWRIRPAFALPSALGTSSRDRAVGLTAFSTQSRFSAANLFRARPDLPSRRSDLRRFKRRASPRGTVSLNRRQDRVGDPYDVFFGQVRMDRQGQNPLREIFRHR